MKLLIASNNMHKFKELSPSLERLGFHCFTPDQLNIRLPQEVECYDSYQDNARSKVQALLHAPVDAILGDDSGLEVMALGNQPGLHSARYAGTGKEEDNRAFLLQQLHGIPFSDRQARFICLLCLWFQHQFYFFEGCVDGYILEQEVGTNGFGYDPLFYLPSLQKTFSQISQEQKFQLSHRGRAMEKCICFLTEKINTEGGS